MAKKKKNANLDPDLPTELELRLEEELRSAYEAGTLEEGGFKDVAVMDGDETLILTETRRDRVERNRSGEEGELEKVLQRLSKEQLVEIVKEAVEKDREFGESLRKRFGFVTFKRRSDDAVKPLVQSPKRLVTTQRASVGLGVVNVEKRHHDETQDRMLGSSRRDDRHEFLPSRHRRGESEERATPGRGTFGKTGDARLTSYGQQDQLRCRTRDDDYQHKYFPSGYRRREIPARHSPGVSAYDRRTPVANARAFNSDSSHASSAFIDRQRARDYWPNSLPGGYGIGVAPMNQMGSRYSNNARYENIQDGYMDPWLPNNQYGQPHSLHIDSRRYRRPIHR